MNKLILGLALSFTTFVTLAGVDTNLDAKRPINCKNEENSQVRVGAVSVLSSEKKDDRITFKLLWTTGKCRDVVNSNGHVPKRFYYVNFWGNKVSDLLNLNINTIRSEDGKYNLTTLSFHESELQSNQRFKLVLGFGLLEVKYKVTISESTDDNNSVKLNLVQI